jgi:hypothetical protein
MSKGKGQKKMMMEKSQTAGSEGMGGWVVE